MRILATLLLSLLVATLSLKTDEGGKEESSLWESKLQASNRQSEYRLLSHSQKEARTIPYTILDALRHFPETAAQEELVIYVVGAVEYFEGMADWSFLWEARPPSLKRIDVVVIFPNVDADKYKDTPSCSKSRPGLHLLCLTGFFPHVLQRNLKAPDLAFISAPGFPQEDRMTWDAAIRYLFLTNTPTIWSHYHHMEEAEKLDQIKGSDFHDGHKIHFPPKLLVREGSTHQDHDVGMFNIEMQYTRSTLSTYAKAMGIKTSGWRTTYNNPYAIEGDGSFDDGTDGDDSTQDDRQEGIAMNIALLATGRRHQPISQEMFKTLKLGTDPESLQSTGSSHERMTNMHKSEGFTNYLMKHTPIYASAMWQVARWAVLKSYGEKELAYLEGLWKEEDRIRWLVEKALPDCGRSKTPDSMPLYSPGKTTYDWHDTLWKGTGFNVTMKQSHYLLLNLQTFFGVEPPESCFDDDGDAGADGVTDEYNDEGDEGEDL